MIKTNKQSKQTNEQANFLNFIKQIYLSIFYILLLYYYYLFIYIYFNMFNILPNVIISTCSVSSKVGRLQINGLIWLQN